MSQINERVRVEVERGRATLVLTRPDKHNGVDPDMLKGVLSAQRALKKRRDVRAVIVRGEGPSFCAGIDAKQFLTPSLRTATILSGIWWPVRNWFQGWSMGFRELGVPVIAAVHGNCFGAGIQLALGADIRFATPDARISIMEAQIGLVPDMGGPTLLRELVPLDVAKELTFTARVISGTEAHALGLITHVAEDPYAAAVALADEILARSPDSVAAGKFLLQHAWRSDERRALGLERHYQGRVIGRDNMRRALASSQRRGEPPAPFLKRNIES
ncbi:MAG TPA: crotonase/enoyl-CoA hydratase family protein [Polyangiales bacterium]